jgi:ribose/xylose/arabinose/galactoside ABC-type transport system permease subunit
VDEDGASLPGEGELAGNGIGTVQLKRSSRLLIPVAKNWAVIFLFLLIVLFSFTGRGFFSLTNFQNIIHLSTIFLLLSAAETYVIIAGGIDLSVGFVMGLSSVLSAKIMQLLHAAALPQPASIVIGSMVGIAISLIPGLISGALIARLNVPPFIATLGMWGVTNGITLRICQGFPISFLPSKLVELGNGYLLYVLPGKAFSFFHKPPGLQDTQIRELIRIFPNSLVFSLVVLFILWHVLKHTKFGQHTYAIGGSMDASLRAGINVKKHLIAIYTLSSFLAGLAGVFNIFQTGIGNFTPFSSMYELFAIAGVIIGGASLMGGKGSILGSCIGAVMIRLLENGLSISGVEPFYRFIAVGLILIMAVVIDQMFPDLF